MKRIEAQNVADLKKKIEAHIKYWIIPEPIQKICNDFVDSGGGSMKTLSDILIVNSNFKAFLASHCYDTTEVALHCFVGSTPYKDMTRTSKMCANISTTDLRGRDRLWRVLMCAISNWRFDVLKLIMNKMPLETKIDILDEKTTWPSMDRISLLECSLRYGDGPKRLVDDLEQWQSKRTTPSTPLNTLLQVYANMNTHKVDNYTEAKLKKLFGPSKSAEAYAGVMAWKTGIQYQSVPVAGTYKWRPVDDVPQPPAKSEGGGCAIM